jgi:hypothetical protein
MNNSFRFVLLFTVSLIFLSSCKKKVIQIIPVIEIEKNMSVEEPVNIKFFAFQTSQIGFAAADTNYIYKTIDGGSNWDKIYVDSSNPTRKCSGLDFFDEQQGLCAMGGRVYVTNDGGISWTDKQDGDYIQIADDGTAVVCEVSNYDFYIYTSTNNGQSFSSLNDWSLYGDDVGFRVLDRNIYIQGNSFSHDDIHKFDIHNSSVHEILNPNNGVMNDFYSYNDELYGVGFGVYEDQYDGFDEVYRVHSYEYYSIDGYQNFIVCVGEKSLVSNMEGVNEYTWNEVFNTDGNSFSETFYKIRFINSTRCYLSGSNGTIYKIKI